MQNKTESGETDGGMMLLGMMRNSVDMDLMIICPTDRKAIAVQLI